MHLFDAPAAFDEGVGQPVEQFGVRGAFAVDAKVGSGGDDAAPKVLLPNAIHHHPRREWIFRRGDPLGQRRAPTAGRELPVAVALDRGGLSLAGDGRKKTSFHHLARLAIVTADQNPRGRQGRAVRGAGDVAHRQRVGLPAPQPPLVHRQGLGEFVMAVELGLGKDLGSLTGGLGAGVLDGEDIEAAQGIELWARVGGAQPRHQLGFVGL